MFTAKDIEIKLIDSKSSRKIVSLYHYSGKCTQNSQIHFGVFLDGRLEGSLQFGPSIDKRRMAQNLGVGFDDVLELNRMALSDRCPKNSESRALGVCLRMLKKQYKHLKVIVSFADACQCGDGTIYRASGFKLHSFKKNVSLLEVNGEVVSEKTLKDIILPNGKQLSAFLRSHSGIDKKTIDDVVLSNGKLLSSYLVGSYKPLDGYQMKYLYFFDKELEKRFKFIDFADIPSEVKMYKGLKRVELESKALDFQSRESGAIPTNTLQSSNHPEDYVSDS